MEEHLPLDHPLNVVYRGGAALTGIFLLAFGIAGFLQGVAFFTTHGARVFGMHTNGLLSLLSIVFGLILLGGAVAGGNVAANVNTALAGLFLLSGLVNLCVIRTDANFLSFRMSNIIFSLVVGLVLLVCGLYGRVTGGDPRTGEEAQRPLGSR